MSDTFTKLGEPDSDVSGLAADDPARGFGNAPTVIYDGQCNFCIAQINNLKRLDLRRTLQF
ncbi:MAG: hypothetical protein RL069_1213, partial [Planctomycetota bacterium]